MAASEVSVVLENVVATVPMVVFEVSVVTVVAVTMLVQSLLVVANIVASILVVLAMADTAMDKQKADVSILVAIRVTNRLLEGMVVKSVVPLAVAVVLTDPEVTTRGIELQTSPEATKAPSAPRKPTLVSKLSFPMVTNNMLMVVQLASVTSDMQALVNPSAVTTLKDALSGEYVF